MPANLLTSGAKRLWGLRTQSLSFLFKYVLIVILVFVREKTIFSKVSFIFDAYSYTSFCAREKLYFQKFPLFLMLSRL